MRKLLVFDHADTFLCEIHPEDVMELTLREVVNGEHSLTITTFQVLEKGWRVLEQDKTGKWREFVVIGVDEAHESGEKPVGTYYCVWSLQHDLTCTLVSVMPGVQTPVSAASALISLLSTTERWNKGTVTVTSSGGASMYDTTAWRAMAILVETWGGEVDATIQVNSNRGVVYRFADLYSAQGQAKATRRFDFGADVKGVRRAYADTPMYCRISPRGKGEESGEGYGRKITIESVNDGKDYLEYAPMVNVCKLPDGNGGYEYPTLIVENPDMETPADLLAWAEGVLEAYCKPSVSYKVDVVQFGEAGAEMQGVALGDSVYVVDRKFGDGLRLEGRVVEIVVDEVSEQVRSVSIGALNETLTDQIAGLMNGMDNVKATVDGMESQVLATADYLDNLIDNLNDDINANGGYTYITDGSGIRTYDTAVSNPLIGAEASKVVEIKGGSIRIANSRTSGGDWNWRSVFVSGHVAADLVTAANITTGFIGNVSGSYWDLDGGTLVVKDGSITGSTIVGSRIRSTDGYVEIDLSTASVLGGFLLGSRYFNTANLYGFYGAGGFALGTVTKDASGRITSFTPYQSTGFYLIDQSGNLIGPGTSSGDPQGGVFGMSGAYFSFGNGGYVKANATNAFTVDAETRMNDNARVSGNLTVYGSLVVTGSTKSILVETENYSDRLMYCYETPTPMFGDVGSGEIGDDGTCIVSIDDIFGETARTDYEYQVFLQKRGEGDAWVEEKEPRFFTVSGTPGLSFDWEIKARQVESSNLRMEDYSIENALEQERPSEMDMEEVYEEELSYIERQERTLYEAA